MTFFYNLLSYTFFRVVVFYLGGKWNIFLKLFLDICTTFVVYPFPIFFLREGLKHRTDICTTSVVYVFLAN